MSPTKDASVAQAGVDGAWQDGHNLDVGLRIHGVRVDPLLLEGHQ